MSPVFVNQPQCTILITLHLFPLCCLIIKKKWLDLCNRVLLKFQTTGWRQILHHKDSSSVVVLHSIQTSLMLYFLPSWFNFVRSTWGKLLPCYGQIKECFLNYMSYLAAYNPWSTYILGSTQPHYTMKALCSHIILLDLPNINHHFTSKLEVVTPATTSNIEVSSKPTASNAYKYLIRLQKPKFQICEISLLQ